MRGHFLPPIPFPSLEELGLGERCKFPARVRVELGRQMVLGDAIARWLACSTNDRVVGVRVPLATGGHVTTVGQLLLTPWAWVYSTFHPVGVNEYRLRLGRYKAGMCDAAWCAPCTWAPLMRLEHWLYYYYYCLAWVRYNKLMFTFYLYQVYLS